MATVDDYQKHPFPPSCMRVLLLVGIWMMTTLVAADGQHLFARLVLEKQARMDATKLHVDDARAMTRYERLIGARYVALFG
ncbi:hypothetical protein OF83DRAFT_1175218 [Amylostereum chailletii]|nr:hypothetical protein OF83DRAFT_1175218 [Amylostereum chailletii]